MSKKSVAQNYVYNLMFQILTIITPLITTPYLTRVLGAKNLGIYGYVLSIVTYFILFGSLGISLYGQREIAYVQDDIDKRSKIFFELVFIRFINYILVFITYYCLFCINGEYASFYKIMVFEMFANAIDISWYFQGLEEFKKTVVRNLFIKILSVVLIFVLVKNSNDLGMYCWLFVLCDFVGNLVLWFYLPKSVKFNFKGLELKKHIKPLFLLFIPQVAIQIYTVLDKTMVGLLTHDMTEVGYYDQAQKLIRALILVVTALGLVMNSRIANSYAKKDKEKIKYYLKQSFAMVWLIATPLIFGTISVAKVFIPIYMGEDFAPVILLISVTAPILLAIGLNNITGMQYLVQVGKNNVLTISVLIGALTNVILNIILINLFGTVGAVISSVFVEFLILTIHFVYIRDVISVFDVLKQGLKNIVAAIVMFVIVMIYLNYFPNGIVHLLLAVLIGAMTYCASLVLLKDEFFINLVKNGRALVKNR